MNDHHLSDITTLRTKKTLGHTSELNQTPKSKVVLGFDYP